MGPVLARASRIEREWRCLIVEPPELRGKIEPQPTLGSLTAALDQRLEEDGVAAGTLIELRLYWSIER